MSGTAFTNRCLKWEMIKSVNRFGARKARKKGTKEKKTCPHLKYILYRRRGKTKQLIQPNLTWPYARFTLCWFDPFTTVVKIVHCLCNPVSH